MYQCLGYSKNTQKPYGVKKKRQQDAGKDHAIDYGSWNNMDIILTKGMDKDGGIHIIKSGRKCGAGGGMIVWGGGS